ncbi:unnamed protein product [Adineta ricciae]|uniref:Protein KRI1 homolog n=1 Tax=Adineta ricciae TaxID=249248 RepID=A0A816A1P2_ADIRI|nr:unnamed protein product [Adineta ricciae]
MFDDQDDTPVSLTINKAYANKYQNWREKEEKQKLIARYGSDVEDDSDEESEDENGEEWTEDVEKEFLRCYSILKKRDPKIYDSNTKFFNTSSSSDKPDEKSTTKPKKEKKMNLKDAEIQYALAEAKKNGAEDDDDISHIRTNGGKSIIEEQEEIKRSIKKALSTADDDDDDGLFSKKVKSETEKTKEDEEYIEWLKGQKKELPDSTIKTDLEYLHEYWNDPSLSERDRFLRDFILNKKHLRHADDDEDDETNIPSYDEIVNQNEDEDEEFEKAEEFERKFNFRYQEPDAEFLKRYPRTIDDSVRRKDDRRKLKRQEKKQRKELERKQKSEEIKRLKNLKKKEILDKMNRLKTVAGDDGLPLNIDDLNADFDPKEYDRRMQELFDDNYYAKEVNEDEQSEISDEELQVENWDRTDELVASKPVQSNNQTAEVDQQAQTKKSKKKSKLRQAISQSKPTFDPKEKSFEQYFDEYYKLDCEDFIGDTPVRFQYRSVEPNDFGLTIEEILAADDRELNAWCSLKKTSQYRAKDEEIRDRHVYRNKAKNIEKKKKILSSVYQEKDEENER